MHQRVVAPALLVEDSAGSKQVALGGEDHLDGVDPSVTLDPDVGAVGPAGEDTGPVALAGALAVLADEVIAIRATGKVEPPVRRQIGAVLVGVADEVHLTDQPFPAV